MENPVTRVEMYLAKLAGGGNSVPPRPVTRIERFLQAILDKGDVGGGGSGDSMTDEEALVMLAEEGMLPAATSDGAILTDGNGNILLF